MQTASVAAANPQPPTMKETDLDSQGRVWIRMLGPFFELAARSPSRQAAFRRALACHLLVLGGLTLVLLVQGPKGNPLFPALIMLTAGIVEGALLLGWRLTQLPRSQSLEFLLVSPIQPYRLFIGEALVGLAFLGLITLSGLPFYGLLLACGSLGALDLPLLILFPFTWGAITGLGLVVWAYEPRIVRQIGEGVMIGAVVFYLIVGVLIGEKILLWAEFLPPAWKLGLLRGIQQMHLNNPFSMMQVWWTEDLPFALPRLLEFEAFSLFAVGALFLRACFRLQDHFRERHYFPAEDLSGKHRPEVGNQPLAWWAVKRVTEYSGQINLWLAGGFGLVYSIYLLAGPNWPTWMGQRVLQIFDFLGGAPMLTTVLAVLAAVPAAFQYGLWDSSNQDRCRRLELLLLTHLQAEDYWQAALAAAFRRGWGYFAVALMIWTAALGAGLMNVAQVLTATACSILFWGLCFVLGFRAFSRGIQANGLGLFLTIGLPTCCWLLSRAGYHTAAAAILPGTIYFSGLAHLDPWAVSGPILATLLTLHLGRTGRAECDARLRQWYDQNHGQKVMS